MSKPNLLFIFADQLRYDALACNGNRDVRTPAIDRLAREGVVFDQAFSSCPVCSPYRGQLLTGRYSHVNGVVCNEYELFDGQTTLPQALGAEGYRTAFIGKWHLGYGPYPEAKRHGFDDLLAHNCCHDYFNSFYYHNEAGPFPLAGYAPQAETQLTLDYIRGHVAASPDQPFAAVLAWEPPHWWSPPGVKSFDYAQYPHEYRLYDPAAVEVPGNVPGPFRAFAAKEFADYYALVTSLDDCLATITEGLEELGIADDTILVFTSDHGDHLSAHGYGKPADSWLPAHMRGSKFTPYEESIHIPFVLRYPNRVPGHRRTSTMLNSVDVMPTLLGLCGIECPDGVQGLDLSHAALGASGPEPEDAYLQILGPGYPNRTTWYGMWRGVRTRQYTYARWHDRGGQRWLFDREADPLEMTNLVDDPDHAVVAEELEERLRQWIRQTDDPFDTGRRLPETNMLDLGQRFTHPKWYDEAPPDYARALRQGAR